MADFNRSVRELEKEVAELEKKVKILRQRNLILKAGDLTLSHKGIDRTLENVGDLEQIVVRYKRSDTELLYKLQAFSGMSIAYAEDNEFKVMFHPMHDNVYDPDKWSVIIEKTENGYNVGRCLLPESITLEDLDNSKPLNEFLDHISNLLNAYQNRKAQYNELQAHLESRPVQISSITGFLTINIYMTLTVEEVKYEVQVSLSYEPMKVLPQDILIYGYYAQRQTNNGFRSKMSKEDMEALKEQCQSFLTLPLKQAFDEAF